MFIGSSTPNLNVARALADCLSGRGFIALVWNQELFKPFESTLDALIRIAEEVDFGVFVWGASDVLLTIRGPIPAPRDNVVFETGLFLGALGKDRMFMVVDPSIEPSIPSDFSGITRVSYDGTLLGAYDTTAVSAACNTIERSIKNRQIPWKLQRLQGRWVSLFPAGPLRSRTGRVRPVAAARSGSLSEASENSGLRPSECSQADRCSIGRGRDGHY